ncbi:putative nuclease HARBI1 [Lates japonicus]|uniref:Nuclease HARBI1 n=1 Tax=Lates japonicus TaxID=270547 RepID=A0AAD3MF71_LATJO|nr:putative nuclease HARBI1 [Lates japonicus]
MPVHQQVDNQADPSLILPTYRDLPTHLSTVYAFVADLGFGDASFQPPAVTHSRETSSAVGARGPYCRVNLNVPLLRLYFEEGDLRKEFHLSRSTMEELIHLLGNNDHGWRKAFEVLVFVYCLACGTSYRVVSEAFDIPRTTCHDMVHRVSKDIQGVFRRVICIPNRNELEVPCPDCPTWVVFSRIFQLETVPFCPVSGHL